MNENRREFLENGTLVIGSVVAGVFASQAVRRLASSNPAEVLAAAAPQPAIPALTADGRLVHLEGAQADAPAPPRVAADSAEARLGISGRRWVMVIDLAKCDGCRNCTLACNAMHHTPADREWIRVFQMQDAHHTAPYWFPKPCFHCDNPPCTKVCPVGATFKRQDGIVLIDNERCIGCRFCMAACPYSTRFFNWGRPDQATKPQAKYSPETGYPRRVGTVEKCDFCPEMARAGMLPACVTSCDMGAIYFGDQNEDAVTGSDGETLRFSQLLEERAGYRYMEELGTEPRVYYLPPKHREYPGPNLAKPGSGTNSDSHSH